MKFCKDRLYRFAGKRWNPRSGRTEDYDMIVIGALVRSQLDPVQRKRDCRGEFKPDNGTYRIDDGHLPDYQPRVRGVDLPALMGERAIRFAFPVAS